MVETVVMQPAVSSAALSQQPMFTVTSVPPNVMMMFDHDLDGKPDEFSRGPTLAHQSQREEVTSPDSAIGATWSIGIGYCVNWFLHDLGSAAPRR
jgi:hypothetical protein